MSEASIYGELNVEKLAQENTFCRQAVRELSQYGINDRQRLFIINLLALELENIENVKAITSLIKELDNKTFISGSDDDHNEIMNV